MANEKRLIDANYVEIKIRQIIAEVQEMRYRKANSKRAVNYVDEIYKLDNWLGCYSEVLDIVENAPTVDAVEVVYGHMVERIVDHECPWYKVYDCSECGCSVERWHNYCPNCGAKMDGDGNG